MKTGGRCLLFLAHILPGVRLHWDEDCVHAASNSEAPIYRPVLQPSATAPLIGTYVVEAPAGRPCVKATMGVQYIVIEEKKSWFVNLDPSRTRTSGLCGGGAAVLSLTLPDDAASLVFTFRKENNLYYVTTVTAHVSPVCQGRSNRTYSGVVAHDQLFTAACGQSFKCKSDILLWASLALRIKLVPLQVQAFSVPAGQYGPEVECLADFNKRVIPLVLGAVAVGVLLIALLTFLLLRDRRRGYERL